MNEKIEFRNPSIVERIKGMLSVDFYRLFHTPLFYIFLGIAAIIPALVSMGMSTTDPNTGQITGSSLECIWIMVAVEKPLYVVNTIAEYANMNMVFIFGGIMASIFIGHDYKSGYVKQLFTTHAKKQDYMISKTLICAFSMACMCLTYLLGTIVSGIFNQISFRVNAGSLILAILGKMVMSLGWASLYTFLNIIFRRYFGLSIFSSFFFGTGILIIGVGAIVDSLSLNSSFLNIFLYGSSVNACLSSNFLTLIICIIVSLFWAVAYNLLGTYILNKSDVY